MLTWSQQLGGRPAELEKLPSDHYLPERYPQIWKRACDAAISQAVLINLTARQRELPSCSSAKRRAGLGRMTVGQHIHGLSGAAFSSRAVCALEAPRGRPGRVWQWLRGAPCAADGWLCLFRPFDEPPAPSAPADHCSNRWAGAASPRWDRFLWLAAYTQLISRPSEATLAWAAERRRELRPHLAGPCARFPAVSLQARRGDKCNSANARMRPQHSFSCGGLAAYLPALRAIRHAYGSRAAPARCASPRMAGALPELEGWHVLYHAFNRTAHEAQRCEPMPVCQWIEYRREKLGIDTAGMGFSLAADLHLLAGGGVFVGQFDSETGRIAYLRMAARLGLAPPFWHYQSTKERARAWHPFTRRPRMWAEV
ncbi:hypothetical protein EMIHUDRAFT_248273 [Emiliania huxleyi CCMP1516]|uniref:Uncharacterized protein n=2 Tax=Emiliania huxleyi TaxID=2903 RepID=A0A0D3IHL8_EMIH1|nr:hypothetical protein EMIHUDRAFT_248273 [Emiliania huxleyi CCMP1516]EOD10753.1 hypothetical protein EMIHUDRAFT_248273 [Emiliania huxleyi CCMP1516]|eukprot:XP_005763182.1 hypothetical protein EMIHUDRAFT_248273 [Emiliania huxleyi CCMP1516]